MTRRQKIPLDGVSFVTVYDYEITRLLLFYIVLSDEKNNLETECTQDFSSRQFTRSYNYSYRSSSVSISSLQTVVSSEHFYRDLSSRPSILMLKGRVSVVFVDNIGSMNDIGYKLF